MTIATSSRAAANGIGMPASARSTRSSKLDVTGRPTPAEGGELGGRDPAAALRHGGGIVRRDGPVSGPGLAPLALPPARPGCAPPSRRGSSWRATTRSGSTSSTGTRAGRGRPCPRRPAGAPGVLLIHGLAQTAWTWAPVARRLVRGCRVVAMDLRGHGLSDAPTDGYEPDQLADDAIAVAEGAGLLALRARRPAGPSSSPASGYGAIVAAWTANALGDRCAGLVLVDGGWEDLAAATDATPDEWLAAIEEPPEVLASMAAWLADREAFDPATWDADQERAARAQVVETAAGRVKLAVHPHALRASVAAMWSYDPPPCCRSSRPGSWRSRRATTRTGRAWRRCRRGRPAGRRAGDRAIRARSVPGAGPQPRALRAGRRWPRRCWPRRGRSPPADAAAGGSGPAGSVQAPRCCRTQPAARRCRRRPTAPPSSGAGARGRTGRPTSRPASMPRSAASARPATMTRRDGMRHADPGDHGQPRADMPVRGELGHERRGHEDADRRRRRRRPGRRSPSDGRSATTMKATAAMGRPTRRPASHGRRRWRRMGVLPPGAGHTGAG